MENVFECALEEKPHVYERFDSAFGVVTGRCGKGAFLTLDNGELAFAYKFSSLLPGTKVLCSIQKPAQGELFTRVSVDSVLFYPPLMAAS